MTHKILCVDDDLSIRTMLDKALRAEGYDVITAINGEEAVQLAESQEPDLILLDVGLPRDQRDRDPDADQESQP